MIAKTATSSHSNLFPKATRAPTLLADAVVLALAIGLITASIPNPARSQERSTDEAQTKESVVAEAAWQLPTPPMADDLLQFYTSPTTGQSFAVDAKSLTVGADGVVRYTIVGTSSSGAKNIGYEGIRCSSHEKKLVAMGHADGTWARARNADWEPIMEKGTNLQHAALAEDYLCMNGSVAGTVAKILNALRYRQPQSPLR
ncbi:MAG: CNP1-like family protein [Burkholderiales bacterium]